MCSEELTAADVNKDERHRWARLPKPDGGGVENLVAVLLHGRVLAWPITQCTEQIVECM